MNFEILHVYYEKYVADRSNANFTELYRVAVDLFKKSNRTKIKYSGVGDMYDADTILDDAIWALSQLDDISNFGAWLTIRLKYRRCDFYRKEGRRKGRIVAYLDDEDNCNVIAAAPEPPKPKQKEKEQRQLLQFLVDHSTDKIAIALVDLGRSRSDFKCVSEMCRALDIHHVKGFRALRRLGRRYDKVSHGDICEYFPENVRIQRQYLSA
jgi:hypothetical protein